MDDLLEELFYAAVIGADHERVAEEVLSPFEDRLGNGVEFLDIR